MGDFRAILCVAAAVLLVQCSDTDSWTVAEFVEGDAYGLQFDSPNFELAGIYPSMRGPANNHYFAIGDHDAEGLYWIKAFSVEMVTDAETAEPDPFMCHHNFDYDISKYYERWGMAARSQTQNARLATLTQGQSSFYFPRGYALPVMSDDNLSLNAQVLNRDSTAVGKRAQHKVSISYEPDWTLLDLAKPKPLFQQSVSVMPPVSGAMVDAQGPSCAKLPAVMEQVYEQNGTVFTGHWMAPTGRDTVTSDVSGMLNLPFATTLHAAGVHVHPYCESLALLDVTTGETVFQSYVKTDHEKGSLIQIDALSAEKGIPVDPAHTYHLTCVTNNTTAEPVDMMAVMLLYLYDSELDSRLAKAH